MRRIIAAAVLSLTLAAPALATVTRNGATWVQCEENHTFGNAVCLGFDGRLYKCPADQTQPCVRT